MIHVLNMYQSLLADIRLTWRCPVGSPEDVDEWVFKEGPKLDKDMLQWFEGTGERPTPPEWLKPLWDLAVDNDIRILPVLRTVLGFGYKSEYEPTQQQLEDAEKAFIEVESGIAIWDGSHDPETDPFYRKVRTLIQQVLKKATLDEFQRALPSHGPGAVFPPRKPSEKSAFATQYASIDRYYPWDTWFHGIFSDALVPEVQMMVSPSGGYRAVYPQSKLVDDIVCSLIAVPKDMRGPRLICVHPAEAIWIQQSQRSVIERCIASSPLTSRFINFDDQSVNGKLALESSLSRRFCTLDLKEASDRLSKKLVDYLLGGLADILGCSRATHVRLLSGRTVKLMKWGPMGNCLTFPVESLIFWAIVHTAIRSHVLTDAEVYVFGDDILFPVEYYDVVLSRLVSAGLVPNRAKTFKDGFFRESCGVDAFLGVDITPLRNKTGNVFSYSDLESLCALARRASMRGFKELPECIYGMVSQRLRWSGRHLLRDGRNPNASGIYRYVNEDCSTFLARQSLLDPENIRFNRHLHRWESRSMLVVPGINRGPFQTRWSVLDSLIRLEKRHAPVTGVESDRGLEYALPRRDRLQLGWTPIDRYGL